MLEMTGTLTMLASYIQLHFADIQERPNLNLGDSDFLPTRLTQLT